jgi:hypothetical protein
MFAHKNLQPRKQKMKVGNPLIGAALALLLVLATAQDESVSPLFHFMLVNHYSIV